MFCWGSSFLSFFFSPRFGLTGFWDRRLSHTVDSELYCTVSYSALAVGRVSRVSSNMFNHCILEYSASSTG